MGVRNPATTALRLQVVQLWNGGMSYPEVAAALGITRNRVNQLLDSARQMRLRVRRATARNPDTMKLRRRVVRLWNNGKTQAEIGATLNLTRGAVGRLICEARQWGWHTVRYTPSEVSPRARASQRQSLERQALSPD